MELRPVIARKVPLEQIEVTSPIPPDIAEAAGAGTVLDGQIAPAGRRVMNATRCQRCGRWTIEAQSQPLCAACDAAISAAISAAEPQQPRLRRRPPVSADDLRLERLTSEIAHSHEWWNGPHEDFFSIDPRKRFDDPEWVPCDWADDEWVWISFCDGEAIAILQASVHDGAPHSLALTVKPAWRGRGVGTWTARRARTLPELAGHSVWLEVAPDNSASIALVKKLGGKNYGETDDGSLEFLLEASNAGSFEERGNAVGLRFS